MKNKLNLILTIVGAILSSSTNAQTFYQCVPNACPSGQYFDGANCKSLPATYTHPVCADGQYYNGQSCKNLPSQKLPCFYSFEYRSSDSSYKLHNYAEMSSNKGVKTLCPFISGNSNYSSYVCNIVLTDGDSIDGKTCNNGKLQ